MNQIAEWVRDLPARTGVLLRAWPTWAVIIAGIVQALMDEVVPALPESWGVRAGAVLAAVLVVVGVVSAVVARVTPILFPQNRGLLAPPPGQTPGPALRQQSSSVRVHDPAADPDPLPPVEPGDYPPDAKRVPHRRRR